MIVLVFLVSLRILDPVSVQGFRLRSFDLEQRIAPRHYQPMPVRIVAIDDQSLSRYGQWPWPRTLVARLVHQIAAEKPRVLGVDIIFSEPDSHSPKNIAKLIPDLPPSIVQQLDSLPDNEVDLANAFRELPTVLGVGVADEGSAPTAPLRLTIVRQSGDDPKPYLIHYPRLLGSLPQLAAADRGAGSLIGAPDADGIVRRVPMFIVGDGSLVPTLALEMLRVATGVGSVGILTGRHGIEAATLADIAFPTDRFGRAYPRFTKSFEYRYISAADLLDRKEAGADLRNAFVFLGVTGVGWVDLRETPLGLMAGVEVHAQLLESMLTGNLLRRPPFASWLEIAMVVVGGLVTIFALPYSRPPVAALAFLALITFAMLAAFVGFYAFGLLLAAIYPVVSSSIVFGVMLAANLRSAEAARRHLATELERQREARARIEGELNAARSLQMGLLPHKFLGPPDRADIEVFASIEAARMVGGDLYDFLLLDDRRLAFAIADVSGKGVPAALFMAMTKEVLRSATSRFDEAVDQAFAEANAKVSAAGEEMLDEGADMMFVTAFAGILDLASGRLSYVNAGHEAPFLLRRVASLSELSGQGGPPLGTVDNFVYPAESFQLKPGDALFLYTDGATDAENVEHAFYGMERLRTILASAPVVTAKELVEFVRADIRRFARGADQADDITLLAVYWRGAETTGR